MRGEICSNSDQFLISLCPPGWGGAGGREGGGGEDVSLYKRGDGLGAGEGRRVG